MTGRGRRPARPWLLVAALAAGSTVLAACGTDVSTTSVTLVPVGGGTITVGIDQAPTGCNPDTPAGATWANEFVLEPVLPGAFVTSPGGQAIGNLALVPSAELTSTSPQTVVYSINPRAVWSDGVPITAADFVYAWRQQRLPAGSVPPAEQAASIQGYQDIRSVTGSNGGRTVTVVFSTPFTDWRLLFDSLLPAHVLAKRGWDPDCHTVDPSIDLSGGPYELHAVTPTAIDLEANPRWWGAPPSAPHLVIRIGRGPAQLAAWAADGRADVVQPSSFTAAQLAFLAGRRGLGSQVKVSSTVLALEFDTTGTLTGAVGVRQAVAHAVDRDALVASVTGWASSYVVPAASHIYAQIQGPYPSTSPPPSLPNPLDADNDRATTTTTGPPTAADPFPAGAQPAATARLLTAAGYTPGPGGRWVALDGAPLTLRLVLDAADRWSLVTGARLAAQLERQGIGVVLSTAPDAQAAGAELSAGEADMALIGLTATPYPSEAIAWYTPLLGPPGQNGSMDWSNLDDPALNSLLTQGSRQLNPVTGSTDYSRADALLWDDMASLPLFAEPTLLTVSDQVSRVGPNPYGPNLLWYPQTWAVQRLEPTDDTTPPPRS